jgi:hypothetical protein
MNETKGAEMKVGTRVAKKDVPGSSGTIVEVNTKRLPNMLGKVNDCRVAWDQRDGKVYGAMFSELAVIR